MIESLPDSGGAQTCDVSGASPCAKDDAEAVELCLEARQLRAARGRGGGGGDDDASARCFQECMMLRKALCKAESPRYGARRGVVRDRVGIRQAGKQASVCSLALEADWLARFEAPSMSCRYGRRETQSRVLEELIVF